MTPILSRLVKREEERDPVNLVLMARQTSLLPSARSPQNWTAFASAESQAGSKAFTLKQGKAVITDELDYAGPGRKPYLAPAVWTRLPPSPLGFWLAA